MRYLIVTVLLLTGCAGKEIVREPVDVEIPVPVACVSRNEIPNTVPSAAEALTDDSEPGEKIKQVMIERRRLRAQNEGLRALLVKCAE